MRIRKQLLLILFSICFVIGSMNTVAFAQDAGDVRKIGTTEELIAFANDVNGGQTALNAELTADIDLTGKQWVPIGNTSNKYIGNFDGQGFEIKNMTIDSTEQYQGFFGVVSGGAVIKNLIIDESCSVKGGAYSGGLVGGSNGSGTVTIENCGNEANVTSTAQNAAGIIGVNYGGSSTYVIKNCYNTGDISGTKESAAISGWLGSNAIVENCYNTGNISGKDGNNTFARFSSATFTNCYQLDTIAAQTDINVFKEEAISSGELAYNLGDAWGQNIGSDDAPVLGGMKVYQGYNGTCEQVYSNTELNSVQLPHDDTYNNKGQCGVCGDWHPESVYINGLDLTIATEDMSGHGWSWNNTDKELIINGLDINTTESVGIKLPDGSKILLTDEKECNISVTTQNSYGILCEGKLTIRGNGKINVTKNGGDAIRCENIGGDAGLTIEDAEVTVNGKINIPSTNKNSSLIINNSTVTTIGNGRNRIEVLSGSESTKTEFIVKNSTVTCGFLDVQDTAKTGNLTFCVENSQLDAEMNETSIISSAIRISGKDVDADIANSYVRAYTRCGAWGWNYSYAFRIDGTGKLELNITGSDMLLYGYNRGLNVYTSGILSSESSIEDCTIISYAKSDDGNISIGDGTGNITDTVIDDSIVFVYGNTENSSASYSAEMIGSPTISYDFELPTSLGACNTEEVTPDLVLGDGETLTVIEGTTLKLPDGVPVKVSDGSSIRGNFIGTIIEVDDSVGVLFFDYGDIINSTGFDINGAVVEEPEQVIVKLCQIIEGWYDDAEYTVLHDFTKILTNSATIYAKWVDNHSFTNYESNNDATCTVDGTKTAICDKEGCDEIDTVTDDGSAKGHNFTDYKSNNDATCTADGTKTAVCNREGCNATDTITDLASKLSHTALAERKNVKEATYTEEGYTGDVVCACGEILEKGKKIEKKSTENTAGTSDYTDNQESEDEEIEDEEIEDEVIEDEVIEDKIEEDEQETQLPVIENNVPVDKNSDIPHAGDDENILFWIILILIILCILIFIRAYIKKKKRE